MCFLCHNLNSQCKNNNFCLLTADNDGALTVVAELLEENFKLQTEANAAKSEANELRSEALKLQTKANELESQIIKI